MTFIYNSQRGENRLKTLHALIQAACIWLYRAVQWELKDFSDAERERGINLLGLRCDSICVGACCWLSRGSRFFPYGFVSMLRFDRLKMSGHLGTARPLSSRFLCHYISWPARLTLSQVTTERKDIVI